MPPDRNEDTGKFEEEYPREAFFDALSELDPATTAGIAKRVGCSYDLAYRRLNALLEADAVNRTKIGNTFVWSAE